MVNADEARALFHDAAVDAKATHWSAGEKPTQTTDYFAYSESRGSWARVRLVHHESWEEEYGTPRLMIRIVEFRVLEACAENHLGSEIAEVGKATHALVLELSRIQAGLACPECGDDRKCEACQGTGYRGAECWDTGEAWDEPCVHCVATGKCYSCCEIDEETGADAA